MGGEGEALRRERDENPGAIFPLEARSESHEDREYRDYLQGISARQKAARRERENSETPEEKTAREKKARQAAWLTRQADQRAWDEAIRKTAAAELERQRDKNYVTLCCERTLFSQGVGRAKGTVLQCLCKQKWRCRSRDISNGTTWQKTGKKYY